jgi:hypothetical protein
MGQKSWAIQPTLASIENLDQWLDGVAMAEKYIQASSMESSHQRPVKSTEQKRGTHKPKVFNTNSTNLPKTDANDTRPNGPSCNSTQQHRLKNL